MKPLYQTPVILLLIVLSFSCSEKKRIEPKTYPSNLPVIDLRGLISDAGKDDILMFSPSDSIEYVQLDSIPEIFGYQDVLLTDNHIFLILSQYKGIVVYNRTGKFQKHIEEPFNLFSFQYNKFTKEVYALGKENVFILDEETGNPKGDSRTLLKASPYTQLYPLSPECFLTLYGRNNFYATKTCAALCNEKGEMLTDTVHLTPDEIEKHACWWGGRTFVMEDVNNNYLFFTYFPGNPYQTIFKATPEKIEPAYYLDIESDVDIQQAWEFKGCLYFIFSYWLRGYSDTYSHLTLAMFDTKTHTLKSKCLYKKLIDYSAKYGIENNIDNGLPIQCMKHSYSQKWVVDLIASWNVLGYLKQNKMKENAPEFLKQMNEKSAPVLSIIHYN
ncbi:hypothetical protein [Parabacteroides sp. AM08-6]|uniref:hypothetical protein n=1 Tax=Parabacteroides sp. AM08-6 TaxID=2292053 RepID=UPI000EFFE32B|nr:hypothetical protein [Parabacteroides sp. AM08-6]RHJ78248.1 hypothetical protein DW103_15175 [Parabacteroides sp. AM08-6]